MTPVPKSLVKAIKAIPEPVGYYAGISGLPEDILMFQRPVAPGMAYDLHNRHVLVIVLHVESFISIDGRPQQKHLSQELDTSTAQFVRHIRFQRAAAMLRHPLKPVGEVADAMGYESTFTFKKNARGGMTKGLRYGWPHFERVKRGERL